MPRPQTTTTLQRVRRVLLLGFLAFVGGLVGLYLFGRQRSGELAPVRTEQAPEGRVVQIGRGFRYEVTEDGEKLFDIEADRVLSDESSLYILEGVKVTMERDDGSLYTITAANGSYEIEDNEASLSGAVQIASNDGLSLETEGLELRRRGRVVVSSAPVRLALGGLYYGRADRLEFLFAQNRILLAGKVELGTLPGSFPRASLRAQRTVFFRDTHNFLAEGHVLLRRGDDSLRTRRLSVNFDEADRRILFALASWEVDARMRQVDDAGVPSTFMLDGSQLSIVFDEATGDPQRLEIEGPEDGAARLALVDATELRRVMQADHLWAEFENGRLRQAQGLGGVTVEEDLRFDPGTVLRQVCSQTADASYDAAGTLVALTLSQDVSYLEPGLSASGSELTARGEQGTVDLVGQLASVATPEGRLEAPRIHLDRAAGRGEATDGVRAELASGSGPALASGESAEAPVRIEAGRADWTAEPRSFRFQNDVRAWQAENFLVAERLGMEEEELLADGGVRSVWHQRTALGDDGAPEPLPVTVSASKMRYNREEGRVIYEGNAQIVQGGRSMRCPLLQLELGEEGEFERMYCEGGSQIIDAEGGGNIVGDAAIYNTDAGKVKVVGNPVRLSQTGGGTISARLMVYDFATAIAEIDSVKDEHADLFMSSSEYFKQFAIYTPTTSPAGGTTGAVDPVTGLPVADAGAGGIESTDPTGAEGGDAATPIEGVDPAAAEGEEIAPSAEGEETAASATGDDATAAAGDDAAATPPGAGGGGEEAAADGAAAGDPATDEPLADEPDAEEPPVEDEPAAEEPPADGQGTDEKTAAGDDGGRA